MANSNKKKRSSNTIKNTPKKEISSPPQKSVNKEKGIFAYIEGFLQRYSTIIFWIIFALCFIMAVQLYDPRVTLSGDDSTYILSAQAFAKKFAYPGYQGPLYPISISWIVAIFGVNVFAVKLFSLASIMGFFYITFITFRKRVSPVMLMLMLSFIAINSYILYYAGQAFSEAFYMLVQSVCVLLFFRLFIDKEGQSITRYKNVQRHLVLAVSILAGVLTRSIGVALFITAISYFVLYKQWKNVLYCILSFLVVFGLFQLVKIGIFSNAELQFSSQGAGLFNKDFYHPEYGKEDLHGFLLRFKENSNTYISFFYSIFGLIKEANAGIAVVWLTIVTYVLSLAGLIICYKKNKYVFFAGLVATISMLSTFIIMQVSWKQDRLIIPIAYLLLLLLFYCIYFISSIKRIRYIQIIIPVLALIMVIGIIKQTDAKIIEAKSITDEFGGLTPDWENYLRASRWAAEELPADALVACRKASLSSLYGNGKPFYGVFNIPTWNITDFLNKSKKSEVPIIGIYILDLTHKPVSGQFVEVLRQNHIAEAYMDSLQFRIISFPDSIKNIINNQLAYSKARSCTVDSLIEFSKRTKKNSLFIADSLLTLLHNNKVTHVLKANIRTNSAVKDGNTITTVENYCSYILDKYPNIFTQVHQVGDKNNEPASISKIEWEKCDLFKNKKP